MDVGGYSRVGEIEGLEMGGRGEFVLFIVLRKKGGKGGDGGNNAIVTGCGVLC